AIGQSCLDRVHVEIRMIVVGRVSVAASVQTLKAVILLAKVHVEILGGEADVLAELPLQARADRPSDVVVFGRSKAVCVFARLASVVDWNDRRLDPRPGKATSCIRKQAVIKEIADAA